MLCISAAYAVMQVGYINFGIFELVRYSDLLVAISNKRYKIAP